MSDSPGIVAYNYAIVPVPDEETPTFSFDVFFFTNESSLMSCVRISNVYLHFLLHRLPGLTIEQTQRYLEVSFHIDTNSDLKYEIVRNLRDSCYNNLDGKPSEYIKIYSTNPSLLRDLYLNISKELVSYYDFIDISLLDAFDKLFIKNTETPFRNTFYSTNKTRIQYEFSKLFGIPFVGFNKIEINKLQEDKSNYLKPVSSKVNKLYILDANQGEEFHNLEVNKYFHQWTVPLDYKSLEMNKIKLMSYDIETYNKNANPDHEKDNQYIFCIGFSFFKLMEPKPIKRYCIMSKDMGLDKESKDIMEKIIVPKELKSLIPDSAILYKVENEYPPDESCKEEYVKSYDPKTDYTIYISVKNEEELVKTFMNIANSENPSIILQFNGWNFDCIWIKSRLEKYGLLDDLLKLYSVYDIDEIKHYMEKNKSLDALLPKWRKFPFKLEGKLQFQDNFAIRSPVIQSIDVYKIILKADAKKFSQSGKLDYMLEQYHINNPYNGKPLSKTGLSIHDMFEAWDRNEKFYEIGKYCLQDGWICATLIIERVVIIDKFAMATSTMTSFEDSIYLADGHRVSVLNGYYGYRNGFAYMDEGDPNRMDWIEKNGMESDKSKTKMLGNKYFDTRTVIGGAVRNYHCWRGVGVVAADFSAQYPAQFRSCNIASNTFIDPEMIKNPQDYGLTIVKDVEIEDMYGKRHVYFIKKNK